MQRKARTTVRSRPSKLAKLGHAKGVLVSTSRSEAIDRKVEPGQLVRRVGEYGGRAGARVRDCSQ
jgi:hypothetical protein